MLTASSDVATIVTTVKTISLISGAARPLMTPPRPLRGAGTLRRLRSTGALRGRGAVLIADGSLRKLRSLDRHLRSAEQRSDQVGRPPGHLRRLNAHPRRDQLRQELV